MVALLTTRGASLCLALMVELKIDFLAGLTWGSPSLVPALIHLLLQFSSRKRNRNPMSPCGRFPIGDYLKLSNKRLLNLVNFQNLNMRSKDNGKHSKKRRIANTA
jgi:hypothetical protein